MAHCILEPGGAPKKNKVKLAQGQGEQGGDQEPGEELGKV